MKTLTLKPIQKMSGEITLPGSKSLSNRALLLSSLASGRTELSNLLKSDDTLRMVNALRQLNIDLRLNDDWQQCALVGNGGIFETPEDTDFFMGNAGTAIRPLTSILGLVKGDFLIDGDEYMRDRPIGHLGDALTQLGANIEYLAKPGCPPLKIRGGNIKGGKVTIPGDISSQFLTSLLMMLPLAEKDSVIEIMGEQVSKPYLDITLNIMATFGVNVVHESYQRFIIEGNQQYTSPGKYLIEGDASSASYFFGAAAIRGELRVHGVGTNSVQGDVAFVDVMEQMGASVTRSKDWIDVREGPLHGVDVDLNHIPDAAMTVATVALFATGQTRIRNIYNWRVKETDRMHAMATELRKLGATIETGNDFIVIDPPATLEPATIDTYGDHRVAMSFSLAALGNEAISINDPDCTQKTFPGFFDALEAVSVH